jgi:NAD(P)H dehydrogenase (quinone)
VLQKIGAPSKSSYPVTSPDDLLKYDGILFGIPNRFGTQPAQWRAFWDQTTGIWANGGYWGKFAGFFVSTATMGGGQETTIMNSVSTLVHHGMIFVPIGYKTLGHVLTNLDEVHGGSPWGAGTFAVSPSFYLRSFMKFWYFNTPMRRSTP